MLNALNFVILLKICTMISNFKFVPYFNILQNFVENVRKKPSILSCITSRPMYIIVVSNS